MNASTGEQLTFGMARATDPDTSHQAAVIAIRSAATNRELALAELAAVHPDGLTDFELADRTGVQQTSIGRRRGELRDAGLVERCDDGTGHTLKRPSPTGSPSIVWRCTDAGLTHHHHHRSTP